MLRSIPEVETTEENFPTFVLSFASSGLQFQLTPRILSRIPHSYLDNASLPVPAQRMRKNIRDRTFEPDEELPKSMLSKVKSGRLVSRYIFPRSKDTSPLTSTHFAFVGDRGSASQVRPTSEYP
jgi:hypothetical protein